MVGTEAVKIVIIVSEVNQAPIVRANETAERYRRLAVELAKEANVCRICFREPPRVPTQLSYGKEYACSKCLKGRERV